MRPISDSLQADLYEFTMAAGYFQNDLSRLRATFELYCHSLPPRRSYLVACGLSESIRYIRNLRFSYDDISFLRRLPAFRSVKPSFFNYLKTFRFGGTVWAMREGEVFFPHEPIVQVEAPIIEAQILETFLMSMMHIGTLVATKASRVVRAACLDGVERPVIDFGSRRAHGPEAAVLAAAAAYIGGCAGTSNVRAGERYGIPLYGTMAHSWVEAFDKEEWAFRGFCDVFPKDTALLIDTYDTVACARKIARSSLKSRIKAVRIDSGDLNGLSRSVRKIFDASGMSDVRIIASGNLNEYKIARLVRAGAPIDLFGVGTDMVTSSDAPALNLAYKLVETVDERGSVRFTAKFSYGKKTVAGRKQIFRECDKGGSFSKDIIGLSCETPPFNTEPLLRKVMDRGRPIGTLPGPRESRAYAGRRISRLPPSCLRLNSKVFLKTEYSPLLRRLKDRTSRRRHAE